MKVERLKETKRRVGLQGLMLTFDELHDDVDGLFLGAHSDQLHNVGMVVLLQNPEQHRADSGVWVHVCVCACVPVCAYVCMRATWLPSGTCSSAPVPGSPYRISQLQRCYRNVSGRCTLLQSYPACVVVKHQTPNMISCVCHSAFSLYRLRI